MKLYALLKCLQHRNLSAVDASNLDRLQYCLIMLLGESKVTGLILNEFFLVIKDIFLYITVCSCVVVHQPSLLTTTLGKLLVFLTSAKETVAVIY